MMDKSTPPPHSRTLAATSPASQPASQPLSASPSPGATPNVSLTYLERRLHLLDQHMRAVADKGLRDADPAMIDAYLQSCQAALPPATITADADLPSLERLRRRFSLSLFEESTLLLALAPHLDGRFSERVVALKRNVGRSHPDISLALDLFCPSLADRLSHRAVFSPHGKLLSQRLLLLDQRRAQRDNLLELELQLPPRIQNLLLDSDTLDPALEGFSRLVWPRLDLSQVILPPDMTQEVMALIGQFDRFTQQRQAWTQGHELESAAGLVLLFAGPPGTGKTLLSHAIAAHLGRPLLLIDAAQLGAQRGLDANLDTLMREARLQRAVLLFDDCELLFAHRLQGNRELPLLLAALDAYDGITLLSTNLPQTLDEALDRRVTLRLDFEIPPPSLRERIWRLHLPALAPLAPDVDLRHLAEKFEFSGGYIKNSVTVALNRALSRVDEPPLVSMTDLEDAARSQIRHKLSNIAIKSKNHLTLDDLILPPDLKQSIFAIMAAVRNRRLIFDEWGFGERLTTGRGICVLFRGDSGTGKTLSAEILANELAMPLYRVRIPSIISKYVGETEKNLEKCFHEAGRSNALLLFDEADSIFSKRTEVSSSNDRYSNMEVNLLLQEIERFDGIVILTTNNDAAIDDAFERRLNHKLDFPFPDGPARANIWRKLIPGRAPLAAGVDFRFLGEDFELSGGCIKNAVIRAAYQAAERKSQITLDILEQSATQEYKELGKLPPNVRRAPWE
jgi:SpoVK/Ycf46/Vps4 family AAA+-type ATPase